MRRLIEKVSTINPVRLFLELIIVFLGVYLAFLFTSYKEQQRTDAEIERIAALMQVGLDRYEQLFEGFAQRHAIGNEEFRLQLENNEIPVFYETYFASPQYPVDVINFVLTREGYDVFSLDFYVPLTSFAHAIQRIMYVEEKLVQLGERYRRLPPSGAVTYQRVYNEQYILAQQYYRYLEMRKNMSADLANQARQLKAQIADFK
ncbi:MAG: hypothetical protein AAF564_15830 [Bacteroidota bacterium]